MAHEITDVDQVLFAKGTQVPWHGLAKEVDPNKTLCENAIEHGMDWTMRMDQMYRVNRGGEGMIEVPNRFALVREDTDFVTGVASGDYKLYANMLGYASLDSLVATGMATPNTMGTLRGGAIVWGLLEIKVPDEDVVPGDKIKRYILFSWGNDGKIGIALGYTDVRVVCSNTVHAAWSSSLSKLIRMAHRGQVEANVDNVVKTMDIAAADFKATIEDYRKMVNTNISQSDLRNYVKVVLDLDEKDSNKRATNLIDKVAAMASTGIGNAGIGDNVWGAFNAITEHLSHHAGRNADNRLGSLWFGRGASVLKIAHSEAMKLAA